MGGKGSGTRALIGALSSVILWGGTAVERSIADPTAAAFQGYALTDLGAVTLDAPGGRKRTANNVGQAIGEYYTAGDFAWHAYLSSHGTITNLGLGGTSSFATAINDRGQVIGRSHIPGDLAVHPFLYSDGTVTDLTLGGSYGEAVAINDAGQVIGESYTVGDLAWHAFLFSDGRITELSLGGSHSEAVAVGDEGEVVGRSLTAGNLALHSFLYRNGTITDLTRLAYDLFRVEDFAVQGIGAGRIFGYGYRDGKRSAFILTIPR